ncbi:hypothetical protein GQ53DRAFT_779977 [Thozetella sp. PMI_491]|nr:hypothetical protein GQ53DRAFT_779977 [Thozetella sp. PMI_491]
MTAEDEHAAHAESLPKHDRHGDFRKVQASRPTWDHESGVRFTQTVAPDWTFGDGANSATGPSAAVDRKHVGFAPFAEGRTPRQNYKLLIGAVAPRPIGLVSTVSPDGQTNLAPFSFFNVVAFDPPLFIFGFTSTVEKPNDTLRNLLANRQCVINVISEHMIEAANSTSTDAPYGDSEWDVSGLTQVHDCVNVKPPRVRESVFSIEGHLDSIKEVDSRTNPGAKAATVAFIEGTYFWAREDAVNESNDLLDLNVVRPIGRLGGITYGRTEDVFEILRPDFEKNIGGQEGLKEIKKKQKSN